MENGFWERENKKPLTPNRMRACRVSICRVSIQTLLGFTLLIRYFDYSLSYVCLYNCLLLFLIEPSLNYSN